MIIVNFLSFFYLDVAYNEPMVKAIMMGVALDVITGIAKAVIEHRLNSSVAWKGLIKQFLLLTVPAFSYVIFLSAHHVDWWIGFVSLCLFTVILSIFENWIALGLPFPEFLAQIIAKEKTQLNKEIKKP